MFALVDEDGSGEIEVDELHKMVVLMGITMKAMDVEVTNKTTTPPPPPPPPPSPPPSPPPHLTPSPLSSQPFTPLSPTLP